MAHAGWWGVYVSIPNPVLNVFPPLLFRGEFTVVVVSLALFLTPSVCPLVRCRLFFQGLLDFAFGPQFGKSGYPDHFYASYTVLLPTATTTVSSGWTPVERVVFSFRVSGKYIHA